MQIVCHQCQATYDIDLPTGPFARDQNLVFRCTACGHSIPIREEKEAPTSAESAPPVESTQESPDVGQEEVERRYLLRQQGKVYQVRDEAMLQRWIAERRIWRTDEVSLDGRTWLKADEMDGTAVFFDLVDQAERSPPTTTSASGKGLFSKPQTTDDPLSSMSVSTPDPVESAESHASTAIKVGAADLNSDAEPEEETSMVEVEALPADPPDEPIRLAVEAIPEETPATLPSFDDPTMDLEELDQEGFFTGAQEHDTLADAMESGGGDYDDELEWMQTKRKSMVTWWLLFFGALGGVGYFALDFLNKQDSEKAVVTTADAPEVAQPGASAPAQEPIEKAKGDDSGKASEKTTDEPQDAAATVTAAVGGEPVTEDAAVEATPAAPPPEPTPVASPPPAPRSKAPPAPVRPSPAREIDRGWAKIDQENWSAARTHFSNALQMSPDNGDAQFGLAYVNENEGRTDEAVRQYCRLQQFGAGEAKSEASGRLRALGRECP